MNGWLLETMVSSTLLMLVVLALRAPVARLFGARIAYALWALPLLRMVLPPLPGWSSPWALAWSQPVVVPEPVAAPMVVDTAAASAVPLPQADPGLLASLDPTLLLAAAWLVGAALWFGWQMLRYRRFVGQALADATLLTRQGGTDVLISDGVHGPMAAGIAPRRIFLPRDFAARYSPAEQRLALLHEGAHHDRGDLIANQISLAVLALHWWNPVAHIAHRAFRADQELACDATVLAGADAVQRGAYAQAVLKSACARTPVAACAMNHKSQLKQRIGMMKMAPIGALRRQFGRVLAIGVSGAGLLLTAAGAAPVSPPAPPAPSAPAAPPAPPSPVSPASPAGPVAPVAPIAPRAATGAAASTATPQRKVIVIKTMPSDSKAGTPDGREQRNVRVMMLPGDGLGELAQLDTDIEAEIKEAMAEADKAHGDATRAHGDAVIKHGDAKVVMLKRKTCRQQKDGNDKVVVCDDAEPINVSAIRRDALQSARKAIESSPGLSDRERSRALAALDKAVAESADAPATR